MRTRDTILLPAVALATQPGSSLTSLGKYLDGVLTVSTKLAADLRALPAPPGDQASVDEFNAACDAMNAMFEDMTAAAKANNAKLFGGLSDEVDVASTALNAKLDAFGLRVCGTEGP